MPSKIDRTVRLKRMIMTLGKYIHSVFFIAGWVILTAIGITILLIRVIDFLFGDKDRGPGPPPVRPPQEQEPAKKRVLERVKIKDKWYYAREGWNNSITLSEWLAPVEYVARESWYSHIWHVYDMNNKKVGEFNTVYSSYSGWVTDIEMKEVVAAKEPQ